MQESLKKEVSYRTSRSSGAGGQHVNKVSTKVELLFDVSGSAVLSEEQKAIVLDKLKNRISKESLLILQCDETRSQLKNKEIVFDRFLALIEDALKPVKPRKPTKPSRSSVERRLKDKKSQSEKKGLRKFREEKE
ncbi:MAG: aminoacyl-tRNA hydrolase [Bacteroidales bacterium]|nr:aminoacyl-tRNA hydrolase [Bacteroidales bacterium]